MLKSMTGYGRADAIDKKYGRFVIEINGVNRKYRDININLPGHLLALEQDIRKIAQKEISRGRINVSVTQQCPEQDHKLSIDTVAARQYLKSIKNLKKDLKLKGEINIGLILGLKGVIAYPESKASPINSLSAVKEAFKKALKKFNIMKLREGKIITQQIEKNLKDIENYIKKTEEITPKIAEEFKARIENRLKEAGINVSSDDERIAKELAILADHVDITEELNRMKSHIQQFRAVERKNEAIGKTLDFLLQEMMREANTMGSKIVHKTISQHTIYIKSQLEKIREQIQNIE